MNEERIYSFTSVGIESWENEGENILLFVLLVFHTGGE